MMPIVQEGRIPILGMLAIALVGTVTGGWLLSAPLYVAVLMLIAMFRQPARPSPSSPLAVLSPIDARILAVNTCHDPYCERPAQCVRLVQDVLGPYGMFAPIEGKLLKVWRGQTTGKEHQVALWMQTDEHDDIVIGLHRSSKVGYLTCRVYTGERVGHGNRFGFAGFGRRLDVYLPESARITVEPGIRLRAGQVIGKLRAPMNPETVSGVKS